MFKNKKVIIFDLDGTLFNSTDMWDIIDTEVVRRLSGNTYKNISEKREEYLVKNRTGDTYLGVAEHLKDSYNLEATAQQIHELRFSLVNKYSAYIVDFKKGADQFIHLAKKNGFILVIASLTKRSIMDIYQTQNEKIKTKCNMKDTFDLMILKDEVYKNKPDPEIFLKVLNKLNVLPQDCIILEDSLSGIQAASSAGIEVINIYDKHSDNKREEINQLATYCIKDYQELIEILELEFTKIR